MGTDFQDLYGNFTLQNFVVGAINNAHSAFSESVRQCGSVPAPYGSRLSCLTLILVVRGELTCSQPIRQFCLNPRGSVLLDLMLGPAPKSANLRWKLRRDDSLGNGIQLRFSGSNLAVT